MKHQSTRHRLFLCLLVAGGLVPFSNCASVQPAADVSENETAFAVPFVVLDAKQTAFTGNAGYRINLEHTQTGEKRSFLLTASISPAYTIIKNFPEGDYLIAEYVPVGLMDDTPKSMNVQSYLSLKKGVLVMFPLTLVMIIKDDPKVASASTVYFEYWEINEARRAELLRILRGEGPMASAVRIDPTSTLGPIDLDLKWLPDWFTHWNFSASLAGPHLGMADTNAYTVSVLDDDGYTYTFTRDVSADIILPLSFHAALKIPLYYDNTISGGLSGSFGLIPGKTFLFGSAGGYFSYNLRPFTLFAEAGLNFSSFVTPLGVLGGSGTTIDGRWYGPDAEMSAIGYPSLSFSISAGAQWHINEWLFLTAKYSFIYQSSFDNIWYVMRDRSFTPAAAPTPVTIPIQNIITFGIGIGLN